jgi:hypothetical protein
MTAAEKHNKFASDFHSTVESFLHWRKLARQASELDFEDEIKLQADIKSALAHARAEAKQLIYLLKKDNDLL